MDVTPPVIPPKSGFICDPNADTIAELAVDETVDDEGKMYPPVEYPFDVDVGFRKFFCDDANTFSTRSIDANGI